MADFFGLCVLSRCVSIVTMLRIIAFRSDLVF